MSVGETSTARRGRQGEREKGGREREREGGREGERERGRERVGGREREKKRRKSEGTKKTPLLGYQASWLKNRWQVTIEAAISVSF